MPNSNHATPGDPARSPQVEFVHEPGCPPTVIIDGRPYSADAVVTLGSIEISVMSFVLEWARERERTEAERDAGINYYRRHVETK